MHNTSLWKEMYTNNEAVSYLSMNNAKVAHLQIFNLTEQAWMSISTCVCALLLTKCENCIKWELGQSVIKNKKGLTLPS